MTALVQKGPSRLGQAALGAWVRASGRSWWQAGFDNGRVVNEWDSMPGIGRLPLALIAATGSSSRWEDLPRKGLRMLRLLTPIGLVGHLESSRDNSFFQFKVGGVSIASSNGSAARWCDAHVIGKLVGDDGNCELMAYEFEGCKLLGPLKDNVLNLQFRQVGPLGLSNLSLK